VISRRPFLTGLAGLFMLVPAAAIAKDLVSGPAPMPAVLSPAGAYVFEVAMDKDWRTRPAMGRLYATQGGQRRLLWERSLPQPVRPRYAFVSDDGAVLLLDQFHRVKAPVVAWLIDLQGKDVATLGFDDVIAAAGVTEHEILHQARQGAWIQTAPILRGDSVIVGVADKTVAIDMKTGQAGLAQ